MYYRFDAFVCRFSDHKHSYDNKLKKYLEISLYVSLNEV